MCERCGNDVDPCRICALDLQLKYLEQHHFFHAYLRKYFIALENICVYNLHNNMGIKKEIFLFIIYSNNYVVFI